MIKARISACYGTMSCPIFDFSGKHGDNKLHQVCQLFFHDCKMCTLAIAGKKMTGGIATAH